MFGHPHNNYSKLYDEFLATISSFIKADSNNPDRKIFGRECTDTILHKFIFEGLKSGSLQVINQASILLGQIYDSTIAPPDYLILNFERFYKLFDQLLLKFDDRSVYSRGL